MPGDPALGIVEAHVVAFDPHRGPVETPFVGDTVGVAGVEQGPPPATPGRHVVPKEFGWRHPDQRLARGPELLRHRGIDLRHVLMGKDVVEHRLFVDGGAPLDRLVEHHEKKAILGALEERFQEGWGVELHESVDAG